MKKPITITNIEENLYSAIKQEAVSQNITASELVSNIFQSHLNGKSSEPVATYVQKCEEMQNMIHVLNDDLEVAKNLTDTLQEDKVKLSEQIKDLEAEVEKLKIESTAKVEFEPGENQVLVTLSPLELALINYVADKETKRSGKDISPALLLKTMFSEYCIKGETWFFEFPKRREIKALQASLEEKGGSDE